MSFFSFFKKKKKVTTPDAAEQAKDALLTVLETPNIEPINSVTSELGSPDFEQRFAGSILLRGSTDSKLGSTSSSQKQNHNQNTSIKSLLNPFKSQDNDKLYPDLDAFSSQEPLSNIKSGSKSKELKSMNDLFAETSKICLMIHPKVLNVNTREKKVTQLKSDAQQKVLAYQNMISNFSEFQYDFDNELDVKQNSNIEVYEKLYTFNDVKKCHQKINELIQGEITHNITIPIFQMYYNKFRCYKGQQSDIVDCD